MHIKNLNLSKKYAKFVGHDYSFLLASFENSLRQMDFFYPEI